MLTIFTTPKPFRGHINVIQRNALHSWTLLHPQVEVILFGDEEGAGEAAREFGLRHEPRVERNDAGMKRVDYLFGRAQQLARHDMLCYVNCDIILMSDFARALERVRTKYDRFLMVGRRWDTRIEQPVAFSEGWEKNVRDLAVSTNDRRNEWWIDYFAFPRGTYGNDLLPFVLGTVRWDNWLIWKALNSGFQVVDASPSVIAVHQNHDYGYHPQGQQGVWDGDAAKRNLELAGGWEHLRNILDANVLLRGNGFRRNPEHYWRALIKPWRLRGERAEFLVRRPGRVRYFVHRCRFNLVHGGEMTRGELVYSWIHTFVELVVGRERSHYLEGIRTRARRLTARLRRSERGHEGQAA